MANGITHQPGDVIVQFRADEYKALISLLHELQDPNVLRDFAELRGLEISSAQCARLSNMWSELIRKSR